MFIALFAMAKTRKQPKCPSTDEWIKMWYTIYTQCNTLQPQEQWNNAICNYMEELRGHYAKWNKSDKHVITYMWNLKKYN